MSRNPRILSVLLAVLAAHSVAGCGAIDKGFGRKAAARSGATKVSFASHDLTSDVLVGGLMIYAVSADSRAPTQSFHFASESATSEGVVLPNGNYQFYAVGYSDVLSSMSPVYVRCGTNGSSVTLDGTPVTIPLTVNAANCADPAFSDGGTTYDSTYGVVQLHFFRCYSGTFPGAMTNGMSSSPCAPNSSSPINSLKLFVNSYTDLNDPTTWHRALESECFFAGGTTIPSVGGPRIPQTASSPFFSVTVQAYSDTSCASPLFTYDFVHGPESAPNGPANGNTAYTVGSPGLLLLRDF